MGECGCAFEILRCNEHAGDVILVIDEDHVEFLDNAVRDAPVLGTTDRAAKGSITSHIAAGGVPKEMAFDVPELMHWLADDKERVADFFNRLGSGMWDEWDCGIGRALEIFGEEEFALALRSGASIRYREETT